VDLPAARDLIVDPRGAEHHVLSGWGESVHGWARVHRPGTAEEVAALLRRFSDEGRRVALRGAGRSYGDAALLGAGDVLDLTGLRRVRTFDPAEGVAFVDGGVTIEDLWRSFLRHGYWPSVVPGTMRPTVAGCVAANVHGKNHFRVGGFGQHVLELEVALATGEVRRVRADADRELFRALTGSMGLLGVVTAARVRLHRVHSGRMRVRAFAAPSLAAMIQHFEARAATSDYMVGWVDCFDAGGRGVVHTAHHLAEGEDPEGRATLAPARQELPPNVLGVLPRGLVAPAMSPFARPAGIRAVNAAKYRSAAVRGEHEFLEAHVKFAFLLDYVPGWKRIYAPGGLLQYQSFVPRERAAEVHGTLLRMCRERGIVPWLGVYKRHRACPVLLPHALDGYSFAMDFPVTADGRDELLAHCRAMDDVVLDAGGRFYFAKDQTATPEALRRAYPALEEFRAWKRKLDPAGVLTSDLAVRLGLVEPR
jgi:decaprenylphospho-beta-D-ribofuranose 2-oxidase